MKNRTDGLRFARPGEAEYVSAAPYRPSRPGILVAYCSDGRITDAVEELLLHRVGHEAMDRLCVPGGPVVFTSTSASFSERDAATKSAEFLIQHHLIRRVLLIGHEDCAYYRTLRGRATEDIERRQIEDLRTAVAHFRRLPGALSVEAHFARVRDGHIAFELVEGSS